jgi:tetratricopeptide (TPR) repeat protein
MRKNISKLFLFLCVAGSLPAADTELLSARDKQDRVVLEKQFNTYAAAAKTSPKDADAQYKAALAASYLAEVSLEMKDKVQAKTAAESGIALAEKAVELQPKNGEYYRVLATLCGQVIPANPMAGIGYGKRAKEAIAKALELNPKSADVHLAAGVGNYYLPPMFGGGPEIAVKDFNQAISLDPKSSEAYMWLGIAERKMHKNPEARQAFAKSVELNPRRLWAKEQLEKTPAQ